VPCEVAFDYLADPHHRAEWQSSLARAEGVDGEPRVGQTWVDVTRPGLRPAMETTEMDRPHRWTETGTWRGFTATLTLTFTETPAGCDVEPAMEVRGRGLRAPVAVVAGALAPYVVRSDLRHAAGRLAR
jgi:hypothetical protein